MTPETTSDAAPTTNDRTRFAKKAQLVCKNAACGRTFTAKHQSPRSLSGPFCCQSCRLDAFKRLGKYGQGEPVFRRKPTGVRP